MDPKIDIKKNTISCSKIWVKSFLSITFLLFLSHSIYSQEQWNINGEGSIIGILSSENEIPFWFYKNTSTKIGEYTNGSVYGKVFADFNWGENNTLEAGVSLMLRDGIDNNLQRENVYIEYKNKWLKTTLGAKERSAFFKGLSSNNGNMIWSLNARPMPGLIIEANDPLRISKTFAIDWGIAHYSLNDDRYVTDTRVHYKRLGLLVTFNENHKVLGQMQHFAQWAGTSPEYGELPNDFEAFIDVFFARSGNEEDPGSELNNSVGNHLGSFLLKYNFKASIGEFSAYHEHPFDDGSGTGFQNFPDGVWGLNFTPKNQKLISYFLYEYVDTTNQSGNPESPGNSGNDNYFNNTIYRSGWTYESNIIGTPLFITDKSLEIPIISNRVKYHHIGLLGNINNFEWTFKSTFVKHYGTYIEPYEPIQENWFNYLSIAYKTNKYGIVSIQGGLDTSNLKETIAGGGLSYRYLF